MSEPDARYVGVADDQDEIDDFLTVAKSDAQENGMRIEEVSIVQLTKGRDAGKFLVSVRAVDDVRTLPALPEPMPAKPLAIEPDPFPDPKKLN